MTECRSQMSLGRIDGELRINPEYRSKATHVQLEIEHEGMVKHLTLPLPILSFDKKFTDLGIPPLAAANALRKLDPEIVQIIPYDVDDLVNYIHQTEALCESKNDEIRKLRDLNAVLQWTVENSDKEIGRLLGELHIRSQPWWKQLKNKFSKNTHSQSATN